MAFSTVTQFSKIEEQDFKNLIWFTSRQNRDISGLLSLFLYSKDINLEPIDS